jgi:hypothetical protein
VVRQAFAYAKVYMMGRRIANGSAILAANRPNFHGVEILVEFGNVMAEATSSCIVRPKRLARIGTSKKPPQHLGGRCVISRSAGLFQTRSTMVPIWLAYIESCQGKNLACQTPRSLGAVPSVGRGHSAALLCQRVGLRDRLPGGFSTIYSMEGRAHDSFLGTRKSRHGGGCHCGH